MAIKKSELYSKLWASCDELRGGMDASQYKDYVLVLLFIKYISDKWAGQIYAPITIPEGASFKDMVALKGKSNIGELINTKIIEPLANANKLADMPDFDDVSKLGDGKEMVQKLTNLIAIFEDPALDFSKNRAEGDDILGDAYEYLMRHFASESGKSKGQFYTAAEVSRTLANIIGINQRETSAKTTVYDPTCGSSSLLMRVGSEAKAQVTLYGQEKDSATASLARMNMIIHDFPTAEIKQGNTLANPLFKDDNKLRQFDYVVANPPFSDKRWSNGLSLPEDGAFNRFESFGIPPSKNGDFAYLLHIIRSLKRNGKGAIILPHGVLFRGNAEAQIRENIVKKGLIKGIIGLPANLFYGTGIPACIIVVDKENATNRKGVFMVDAGKGFVKDGNKNRLREQDIRKITDVFNGAIELAGYSRMVPISEIEGNEFNLNIPRYIGSQEKDDIQDIEAHLRGGIPNVDIDSMSRYWDVYPSLRAGLFKHLRENYSELTIDKSEVNEVIFNHEEFIAFSDTMDAVFEEWRSFSEAYLKAQTKGCHPKEIIKDLAEKTLELYVNKPLVDKYDIYQHLLSYWNEIMQDDAYIISYDGWKAETYRVYGENSKKEQVDKGWSCDLIPKYLVIDRYFMEEKLAIEKLNAELDAIKQQYAELEDEHGGEDAALQEVSKKTDAVSNLFEFKELAVDTYFPELGSQKSALYDTLSANENKLNQLVMDGCFDQVKNAKGKITKANITTRLKTLEGNHEDVAKLKKWVDIQKQITTTKKEIKAIHVEIEEQIDASIQKDSTQEYLFEITILREYIDLRDQETATKKKVKEAEEDLDEKLYAKYPLLTEDEIKVLVVDDKWLTDMNAAIKGEIDNISQKLTNRIKELAQRYEKPLPELNRETQELETAVEGHLKKMGFEWA